MSDVIWKDCVNWLIRCQILPQDHRITRDNAQVIDLANILRDGVLLCQLSNKLKPHCIDYKEISLRPQMSQFLCFKNIRAFLSTCQNVFELKQSELFDPVNLFEYSDFGMVLNTLSILSKCPRTEVLGIDGFPNYSKAHDYYNDDIYRNLQDFDGINEDPMVQLEFPSSPRRTREEYIYEDLCYVTLRISDIPTIPCPPLEKKDYCIKELVETEKNYIEALNMIIRNFMRPLKSTIKPEDRKIIFKNIKELSEIHTGFHSELYKACSTSSHRISDCFLNWKEKFIIYGDYCSNLPLAQDLIDELSNRNDIINQAILKCQVEANDGKFRLRDLLSVPMQRILKYHLLLNELLKNTPKTNEEYGNLEKALDGMLDLAQYINEVKRDNETLQIIQDIQSSITDLNMPENTSLKDYGRLLNDGDLKLKSHGDNKVKNRYIFVFDKVMIMCKSTKIMDKLLGVEQYSFKEALVLSEYRIDNSVQKIATKDKWTHFWYLVHHTNKKAYTMYAKTEDIKKKWILAIEKAFETVNPLALQSTDHNFELKTFEQPTTCGDCFKLLRGIFYQGYKCVTCGIGVHKHCLETVHSCGAPSLPPRPPPVTAQDNSISKVFAKNTYRSDIPGHLSFEKNDVIYVTRRPNTMWWEGMLKRTGQHGLFPLDSVDKVKGITYESPHHVNSLANNLPLVEDDNIPIQMEHITNNNLESYDWFAGPMERDDALALLEKLPSGSFLLRISDKQSGAYVISLNYQGEVKHMRVLTTEDSQFYFLSQTRYFKSMLELIFWYEKNMLVESFSGLNITLSIPFKEAQLNNLLQKSESNTSLDRQSQDSSKEEAIASSPQYTTPLGFATAVYDFQSTQSNMLNLTKGDCIAILSKAGGDKGWWKGRVRESVGYFPVSYVSEIES